MDMEQVPVWGPGPFDNVYALQASLRLTQPSALRGCLAEAAHELHERPGSPQYLGYAAAEVVAAAGAGLPYWQSDVAQHPQAIPDRPETGYSFYLSPIIDQWIRSDRPRIPLDVIVEAMELVRLLREQVDLWQDPEARIWYLDTTAQHLDSALAAAEKELEISTEVDDVF